MFWVIHVGKTASPSPEGSWIRVILMPNVKNNEEMTAHWSEKRQFWWEKSVWVEAIWPLVSFHLFWWRRKMLWWWRSDWYKLSQTCLCVSADVDPRCGQTRALFKDINLVSYWNGISAAAADWWRNLISQLQESVCELRCCSCRSRASRCNFKMCCIWTGAHSEKRRRAAVLIQATAHTRAAADCCCVLTFKMYE